MTTSNDLSGLSAKSKSFSTKCPNGHILRVPFKYIGKKVRCPQRECDAKFVVPDPTRSVVSAGSETQKQEQRELARMRRHEIELLTKERKQLDLISFVICTSALFLGSVFCGILNNSLATNKNPVAAEAGLAISLVAFAIGIAYATKRKGQSPLWGISGLFLFLPALVVPFLPDHKHQRLRELETSLEWTQDQLQSKKKRIEDERMRFDWIAFFCAITSVLLALGTARITLVAPGSHVEQLRNIVLPLIIMLSIAFAARRRGRSYFWAYSLIGMFLPLLGSGFRLDENRARLSEIDERCKLDRKLLVEERKRLQQLRAVWGKESLMFGVPGLIPDYSRGASQIDRAIA